MNWPKYYKALSADQRETYVSRVGSSRNYIENHYLSRNKVPRPDRMKALAEATLGNCSYQDILNHFYYEDDTSDVDITNPQGEEPVYEYETRNEKALAG